MAARGFKVPILLPADPAAALEASTKQYVDFSSIPIFANTTARDAWASPPNGALCTTTDTNTVWQRISGAWVPHSGSAPFLRLTKSSDQTINNTTFTDITWNTAVENRLFSFTAGSSLITIPYAGYYHIVSTIAWGAVAGGPLRLNRLLSSAGFEYTSGQLAGFGGGYGVQVPVHAMLGFNTGDQIKIDAYQDTGTTCPVKAATGSAVNSFLALSWIGAK